MMAALFIPSDMEKNLILSRYLKKEKEVSRIFFTNLEILCWIVDFREEQISIDAIQRDIRGERGGEQMCRNWHNETKS